MKKIFRICWTIAKRFYCDKYTYRASALSYTTLLALVPLFSVIFYSFSLFPAFTTKYVNLAQGYIVQNFIPTSGNVIQGYFIDFIHQATRKPGIGLIFLVITTFLLLITIEHAINEIWGAPARERKFYDVVIFWLVLILAPLLLGLSVFISSYIFSLKWITGATKILGINTFVLTSLPLAINTFIFCLLYKVVPNSKVQWRYSLIGGLIAALLFEGTKRAFAFYIIQFKSYELIYGALATIPIFLIWIYISWLIVLFGGLVTHVLILNATKEL